MLPAAHVFHEGAQLLLMYGRRKEVSWYKYKVVLDEISILQAGRCIVCRLSSSMRTIFSLAGGEERQVPVALSGSFRLD